MAGPGQLQAARLIAAVDVRRRLRNGSFVAQAVVGPLVLATIISFAFGGAGGFEATVGVVDADGTEVTRSFAESVTRASAEGLEFVAIDSPGAARRRVDEGDVGAAVVIPEGFTESLTGDRPGEIEVVSDPDSLIAEAVARSVADELAARVNAARLAAATALARGGEVPPPGELAGIELPIAIEQRSPGGETSLAAFFGPSMGLLFLFLTVGTVARGLLEEKRQGVLARVLVSPARVGAVLAGKCLSAVVLSVATLCVIWLVTSVALGADWGDPAGVLLLVVAASLAIAGIAGVIAAAARTEQSADALAAMAGFGLALIGGNFIPPGDLPEGLQRVSLASPNGWALRGFAELSAGEGASFDVLPHAGVLLAWAVVCGGLAAALLPRRLEAP